MIGLKMSPTFEILILCFSISHASWWHPHPHMAWNDVINETYINTGVHGEMFVVDLFEVHTSIIEDLHRFVILFLVEKNGIEKNFSGI